MVWKKFFVLAFFANVLLGHVCFAGITYAAEEENGTHAIPMSMNVTQCPWARMDLKNAATASPCATGHCFAPSSPESPCPSHAQVEASAPASAIITTFSDVLLTILAGLSPNALERPPPLAGMQTVVLKL